MLRLSNPCTRWSTRPLRVLAAVALVATTVTGVSAGTTQTAAAASSGAVMWGAYIDGAPFNTSLIDSFEARTGKKMSIVHWGAAWQSGSTMGVFQTDRFDAVRARGSIPMLTWGSWQLGGGANQPNFRSANIANGAYDSYIIQWAQAARAWGHPFFLRYDHEMNGSWQFPWSDQLNGNATGDYVRSWRHVHDLFVQQGATNVTWVWSPNIVGGTTSPLNLSYPGDNYVDWTGLDGYNWGTGTGDIWQTSAQVFGGSTYGGYNPHDSYHDLVNLAPSKPIMLAEVASVESGGSKASWISDMLATQLPTTFPQVKALVWNDWDEGGAVAWPIESSSSATSAFANAIGSTYYSTNQFAGLSGGAIQPAGGSVPPTATPVPPTATPVPPTATPVPPTATPVPPTATTVPSAPTTVPPTATAVPTAASAKQTSVSFVPVADTYVAYANKSSSAGGSSQTLRSDMSGTDTSFFRFDMSSLAGKTITSASLRLHSSTEAWAGSQATFDLKQVYSTDWKEQWMSYNNTTGLSSTVVGTLVAPSAPNTWYDVTLSPSALQSRTGGLISMALTGRTGDVFIVNSREAGVLAPQLVITYK